MSILLIGFIYMTLATCSLSVVYISTKIVQDYSPIRPYEITYTSGIIVTIFIYLVLKVIEKRRP